MKWPFQDELDRINKSSRNRANRKRGDRGQDIAKKALEAAGYLCVEPIETGWTIIRKYDPVKKQSAIVSAFPKKKVSGDFIAIDPKNNGRLVHCEVKTRDENNLPYSVLAEHQIVALNAKYCAGALCLIAWVRGFQCKLYRWPIEDWYRGKSLQWDS
jgi:hypothetical protein